MASLQIPDIEKVDQHPAGVSTSTDASQKEDLMERSQTQQQGDAARHKYDLERAATTTTNSSTIERPWQRHLFVAFVVLQQFIQNIPYGLGIDGAFTIASAVGDAQADSIWIAASYPLTQGSVVLMAGRLGSVYGHKNMLTFGAAWWIFWTLATAYGNNVIGISFIRALTGIGGGIIMPNAIALLTINIPPGNERNLALALFGAMAPSGAAGGGTIAGIFLQWTDWYWVFFFLACLGLVIFSGVILTVPQDKRLDPKGHVDWVGAVLGVGALVVFNFVWNQAPLTSRHWSNPYIYVCLIVSIFLFVAFILWERRPSLKAPILPMSIFKAPSFNALLVVLFLNFMALGVYLYYVAVLLQNIRHWDVVLTGCAYIPLALLGPCAAFLAAFLVSRVPAMVITGLGCLFTIVINVLLATTPRHQTYWAMIFPAMLLAPLTGDLIFTPAQVITSSIVPRRHQGAAGSLIATLLGYGLSTGLGFAGTVEVYTNKGGRDHLGGIRHAAWLAVGMSGLGLLLNFAFVRMPKNDVVGWQGEDAIEGRAPQDRREKELD